MDTKPLGTDLPEGVRFIGPEPGCDDELGDG